MHEFLEPLFTPEGLVSFVTLALLEIVLGIDNIVFISILSDRLAIEKQGKARLVGLSLALIMRIILLFLISWIVGFTKPLIKDLFGLDISVRDVILFAGGLFLIYKSTFEIHSKLEGEEEHTKTQKTISIFSVVIQIMLLDIVFSFDSILTAIGLVEDPQKEVSIMIFAVVVSMIVMLFFSKLISVFINKHPTIKMLALSFLLMIGVLLVTEAFHIHVPKPYVYFAMAFSLFVEMLNMKMRRKTKPLKLKNRYSRNGEENSEP
ncbi:MAG: TerC family protein [Cytophagaceae bacterium]|nr:TerC family protein [Cytophagaceae bacterium]